MPTPDDYRGWIYRVVAPHSAIAVIHKASAVADCWFADAGSGPQEHIRRRARQ